MSKKGSLILLIGPSGSGKGTVLKELLATEENTFLSISATTRNPRPGEVDGINYFFITQDKFKLLIESDSMLEYAQYIGNFYGTPKASVQKRLNDGENVILEIEVQGAVQVKKAHPSAILIFIIPPSLQELKRRLVDRNTENEETINARLSTAIEEIKFAYECDYVVINDEIEQAVEAVRSIIHSSSCKTNQMETFLDKTLKEASTDFINN